MAEGVSGPAVAAAAIGGFLIYAGINDIDTITGLREIMSGKKPTARKSTPTATFPSATQGIGSAGSGATGAGGALIAKVRTKLGAKYVFGAVGPTVFDCSGLVVWGLRETGFNGGSVPRFFTQTFPAWARSKGFTKIGEKDIAAGDIVWKSGHMGIAISNTRMIHAPHTGSVVKEAAIYSPRYMWTGWRFPGGK